MNRKTNGEKRTLLLSGLSINAPLAIRKCSEENERKNAAIEIGGGLSFRIKGPLETKIPQSIILD